MPRELDTAHRKLTYEDYVLFPDDGRRHEILDGEHYVTAAPYPRHQAILGELHLWIGSFLRQNRLGRVFFAPVWTCCSRSTTSSSRIFCSSRTRG